VGRRLWLEGVYRLLRKNGFSVSVVQQPTVSLTDDVQATKRVLATQNGPVILVGHSYGGAVITEAGNDPRLVALVWAMHRTLPADARRAAEVLLSQEGRELRIGPRVRPTG
jgi:pimeloyl-ACP methyl ester carboxylesterase